MSERELELEFSVAGQPASQNLLRLCLWLRTYVRDDDNDISRGVGNGEFNAEKNIHVEVDDDEEGR